MSNQTNRDAVERVRLLLGYGLPTHVAIQTGEGTEAPAAVFADADYEVGDGTCGLHASGKQANEPCIPYVRADALIYFLDAKEAAEAELSVMKNSGIIEVAVRNPNVSEYMEHWERRAETAEAELAQIRRKVEAGE